VDGQDRTLPNIFHLNPRFRDRSETIMKRRAFERQTRAIHRLLEGKDFRSTEEINRFIQPILDAGGPSLELPANVAPLERAQDMAWKAWDTSDPKDCVRMAEGALIICKDCADAYVILGYEAVADGDLNKARELFEKGIVAGKRTLGDKMFQENIGRFWGILETRPYMRAVLGRANVLQELGERDEAVKQYWELLRLNPNDNQGARYLLMDLLLEDGLDEDAWRLLKMHDDELSADWSYSRVLLEFRRHGDGPVSKKAFKDALEANRFVPLLILTGKGTTKKQPDCYEPGSVDEANCYIDGSKRVWKKNPAARKWLAHTISDFVRMKMETKGQKDYKKKS
jgi:tetratricopeptide (TPR) repeat protein